MDRSAIDTIRGYCYQFDKSILEILSLKNDTDTIEVEGIEDVDVESANELTAIQCKYYEKTEYNHSVIAKPIRFMLAHFKDNRLSGCNYYLYGHYKSGHEKLETPIELTFLKEKLLTFTKNKTKYEEHKTLNLSDSDLEVFLTRLDIDINAVNFEDQQEIVVRELQNQFNCSREEARHYHYNAAIDLIIKLGCNHSSRKISKNKFLESIDKTKSLFNIWHYKYKGRAKYLKKLHSDLFPRSLNTQPLHRVFVIDCSLSKSLYDIKSCIYAIQASWSNFPRRGNGKYSPYIFLNNLEEVDLHLLKNQIFNEGLSFSDGYRFSGSKFDLDTILNAKSQLDIKFQFIENTSDLREVVSTTNHKIEVYEFFGGDNQTNLCITNKSKVQIYDFNDIKDIV